MPDAKKVVTREDAIECLRNFPKVLERHVDLVQKLEERFKTKKDWRANVLLENWNEYDNCNRMYFLGWMRASIKALGVPRIVQYLCLKDKREIDSNLVIILSRATPEEIKAFQDGEDAVQKAH